jgi:NADP-dependent 3-hydroxy acid dehydrogenase YdfG
MTDTSNSIRPLPLTGRHAVVTGANGGIGEAICLELARQGGVGAWIKFNLII